MVDINKLIELVIKYKSMVVYLACFILCAIVFFVGRATVDIPTKADLCSGEEETIKRQTATIKKKDAECLETVKEQRKQDDIECKKRIDVEIERHRVTSARVSCETCKAVYPQCVAAGRW
tara:strand:- start:279 stop:638 length:360 start_codon:yes stop_codon:yes gene_type:complete